MDASTIITIIIYHFIFPLFCLFLTLFATLSFSSVFHHIPNSDYPSINIQIDKLIIPHISPTPH